MKKTLLTSLLGSALLITPIFTALHHQPTSSGTEVSNPEWNNGNNNNWFGELPRDVAINDDIWFAYQKNDQALQYHLVLVVSGNLIKNIVEKNKESLGNSYLSLIPLFKQNDQFQQWVKETDQLLTAANLHTTAIDLFTKAINTDFGNYERLKTLTDANIELFRFEIDIARANPTILGVNFTTYAKMMADPSGA